MNNLHRELAPISEGAWEQIEEEARRTALRDLALRRVVDVTEAEGSPLAAVSTGHLEQIGGSAPGISAWMRESQPLVELRAPFTLTRAAIDDVERGSQDSDWQPVKDAVRDIVFAEDRALADGYPEAGITGIRRFSTHAPVDLPERIQDYPSAVAQAETKLRLAGVEGPYHLLLGADGYTALTETVDHGYPVATHVTRLIDGEIIWAPALAGGLLLSTRGGDFQLHLGQDLSIGYDSHDDNEVRLYIQETFTFTPYTAEAAVELRDRNGKTPR
ncbi:family 1 encapsulin nanocompartment shell protein [Actinospica robiniae]|uniref:family 1 encapsulin nanocompartment shell protein n=1 Tax=Actinospica robiniae TaxID=304901 RepID=UPI00041F9DAD|nr:family 1 encapsulin nanocompartment shell protein [Actinospica robiniae]